MDASALTVDLRKALKLICDRHGVDYHLTIESRSSEAAKFELIISPDMDDDRRMYLGYATPELKSGHNIMKVRRPALHDEMLGKRFELDGKQYLYLGCNIGRPKFPVAILALSRSSNQLLKAPIEFLDEVIKRYSPDIKKREAAENERRVAATMQQINPELADEANFS